ncbi:MAG: folate-binding protein YgfZ [Chromatiales bacterium]|nr:folate-binding protein YgfZ [Chromatiales bacterium]
MLVSGPITHLAVAVVRGADRARFLHAQLTNDVQSLQTGQTRLTGYCTAQGRVLALLRIGALADAWIVELGRELAEPTLTRLRQFVLRADVRCALGYESIAGFGVAGPAAAGWLNARGLLPPPAGQVAGVPFDTGGTVVLADARMPGRFAVYGPTEEIQRLQSLLPINAKQVPAERWRWFDIAAGQPNLFKATSGEFIPQMLNLDAIDAVSFSKGCYPGQEIVARTQYLGKIKRRMYRLHADAFESLPEPGALIADEAQATVGRIVDAQPTGDGSGADLLAVIATESADTGAPLFAAGTSPLRVLPLPYPLPAPRAE